MYHSARILIVFIAMKHGLLLINLGTPDDPGIAAIKRYLREFLADERVITLSAPLRYLLLYTIILPLRSKRSAKAYQAIWTAEGSPLLYHSQKVAESLQKKVGEHCKVVLGMRYGKPSIEDALQQLQTCEKITILPLYPQYSSAATGSSIEKALQILGTQTTLPSINLIRDFHVHPQFIDALATSIKPYVASHDYILFSYHGIPENHLHKSGCKPICVANCPSTETMERTCYRAQCLQTTSLVAKNLGLIHAKHGSAFQSRLGKTPWIKPYTDETLVDLMSQGVKRLAVVCPSFVADCLETLEEIGIQLKKRWKNLGGEELTLIPCLNANDDWLHAILSITKL